MSIAANLLFLAFDANWFRNLAGAVSCAVAVLATGWISVVFPFDFGSAGNNDLARLVVLLALLAVILATLVTTVVGNIELLRQAVRTPRTAEH